MIRRPPRSTLDRSSAASDVYKRQEVSEALDEAIEIAKAAGYELILVETSGIGQGNSLSLIHISEPTRPY